MISTVTKQNILSNRYAFEPNEEVLVNALDLCDELIECEALARAYRKLLHQYDLLLIKYELKSVECPHYQKIDLKA